MLVQRIILTYVEFSASRMKHLLIRICDQFSWLCRHKIIPSLTAANVFLSLGVHPLCLECKITFKLDYKIMFNLKFLCIICVLNPAFVHFFFLLMNDSDFGSLFSETLNCFHVPVTDLSLSLDPQCSSWGQLCGVVD